MASEEMMKYMGMMGKFVREAWETLLELRLNQTDSIALFDLNFAHQTFLSTAILLSDDELYGGLGEDILFGGAGEDILIGDIGYAIRRYNGTTPITKSSLGGPTPSSAENVWRKDIVLEEVGNVTRRVRISQKTDANLMSAEDIAKASLLFVANAYENGAKFLDSTSGEWITELMAFDLVEAFNDHLIGGEGDDVIIGQRGDDIISTGEGNDVAIGDGGTNM